jgi:hypothetical protein
MTQHGWVLTSMGVVAAACVLGGCKSEPLGPGGPGVSTGDFRPATGSAGASGTGETSGGGLGNASGLAGASGLGNASGLGTGGDVSSGCPGVVAYEAIATPPDILIVMNRSQAMGLDVSGDDCPTLGCTKWDRLVAAVDAVLTATAVNNYGFMYFGAGASVCGVPMNPWIGVGPGVATSLATEINMVNLGGSAPVAGTIESAVTYLRGLNDGNPKYILLATDGAPTCASGDLAGTVDDSTGAENAIAAAAQQGIPTFVLGVADPADAQGIATLNAMATTGQEQQTGAATAYYDATSGVAALEAALSQTHMLNACTIAAPTGAPPASTLTVSITRGGQTQVVPYDPTRTVGWDYGDSTHTTITLSGTTCADLGSLGGTDIELKFNCAPDGGAIP